MSEQVSVCELGCIIPVMVTAFILPNSLTAHARLWTLLSSLYVTACLYSTRILGHNILGHVSVVLSNSCVNYFFLEQSTISWKPLTLWKEKNVTCAVTAIIWSKMQTSTRLLHLAVSTDLSGHKEDHQCVMCINCPLWGLPRFSGDHPEQACLDVFLVSDWNA